MTFRPRAARGGEVLQAISDAHKATPRQIALAFLTRAPSVLAIPKASSAEHAAENAAAGKLSLSEQKSPRSTRLFQRGPKPRGLPML
jgi:diketogulonate reductase-like aldo/keto reductase